VNSLAVFINLIVYIIPVISAVYFFVGIKLFKFTIENKANYFSFLMFASGIYSLGYFFELNSFSIDTLLLFRNIESLGASFWPTFVVLFIIELTKVKVSKKVINILFLISTILWLIYITNPLHHLFYVNTYLQVVEGFELAGSEKGPVFFFFVAYYAVLLIFSCIILLKAYNKTKIRKQKESYRFLLIAFQFPWITIYVTIMGFDNRIDLAPATIMILCILFIINEFMNDMFELSINRWKNTFSDIGESAFLVNNRGEVICSNVEANAFISASKKSMKDIIKNLDAAEVDRKPILFTINHKDLWLEVKKNDFDIKKRFTNYLLIDTTERKKAEDSLKESEERYRQLSEQSRIFTWEVDEQGLYTYVDHVCEVILGYHPDELIVKKHFYDQIPEKEREKLKQGALNAFKRRDPFQNLENKAQAKDGHIVWFSSNGIPILNDDGTLRGYRGSSTDITDRKRLETALSNEKNLIRTTLESIGDGVISTDNKGNIVFMNRIAQCLTGWTQEEANGNAIEEVFFIVDEFTKEKSDNIVKNVLESGKILELANHTILISKDGVQRPIEDSAAPILNENDEITGVVLIFRDFSEKKQKQEEILYLSYHDYLTGLYNRRFYEEELKRLDTKRNLPISLVMGDINGLKLINDSFGHAAGDQLIVKAADIIRSASRADDIIARLGGDEFVIILPRTDSSAAEQFIRRIKGLSSKERVGTIDVSIAFGCQTKEMVEENIQEIFKKAEANMYQHKLHESAEARSPIKNDTW